MDLRWQVETFRDVRLNQLGAKGPGLSKLQARFTFRDSQTIRRPCRHEPHQRSSEHIQAKRRFHASGAHETLFRCNRAAWQRTCEAERVWGMGRELGIGFLKAQLSTDRLSFTDSQLRSSSLQLCTSGPSRSCHDPTRRCIRKSKTSKEEGRKWLRWEPSAMGSCSRFRRRCRPPGRWASPWFPWQSICGRCPPMLVTWACSASPPRW